MTKSWPGYGGTDAWVGQSKSWADFERRVARRLGSERVIRHQYDSQPDAIIQDLSLVVDCKQRERWAIHKLFRECESKYATGEPWKHMALITGEKRKPKTLVTVDMHFFEELIESHRKVRDLQAGLLPEA